MLTIIAPKLLPLSGAAKKINRQKCATLKLFFVFLIWLAASSGVSAAATEAEAPTKIKHILLISSFHLTHPWSLEVHNAIRQQFEANYIIDYLELNSIRNRTSDVAAKFAPYQKLIAKGEYDLIVAVLDDAIRLLLEHDENIPPDVPIVICGYQELAPSFQRRYPQVTGVATQFNVEDNIAIGLRLLPNTREIAVVTDDLPSGLLIHQRLQNFAKEFRAAKLTLINGRDYNTHQMLQALEQLPPDSLVIFCPWRNFARDGFNSLEAVADEVTKRVKHPYLILTDVLFGHGALGGYVSRGVTNGKLVAEVMQQVLDRGSSNGIPFLVERGEPVIDLSVLEEAGLNRHVLPPETIFLNRKPSLWDTHRRELIAIGLFVGVILLLLITVVALHWRYRLMTKRNQTIFNALPLRIGVADREGKLLFYQEESALTRWRQTSGVAKFTHLAEMPWLNLPKTLAVFNDVVATRQTQNFQIQHDGQPRLASCRYLPTDLFGRETILWISQDVSELENQKRQLEVNNLLLSRAAEVAQITYFKGDRDANVELLGGNTDLGIPADDQPHSLYDWVSPEDHAMLNEAREQLLAGHKATVELVCRSRATGQERSFRLRVAAPGGDTLFFFGILQDITASVAAANEKNALIQRLNNYVESERVINACLAQTILQKDFDHTLREILHILGTRLQCCGAAFGVYRDDDTYVTTQDWSASSDCAAPTDRLALRLTGQRQIFQRNELLKLPHDTANSGCSQLLCAPVWLGETFFGVLSLCFESELIPAETVLRSAAQIIALAKEHDMQQEALDNSVREREMIFNHIKVPICLFDRNGLLVRVNPAAARLAGCSVETALTRPCFESFCQNPGIPEACPVQKAIRTGQACTVELSSHQRDFQISAEPIFDADGRLIHVIENAIDLTEINERKRQLEAAMEAAQAADRAKSYFLATMSHELRTPLNAVIGFSELLQFGEPSAAKQQEYLRAIHLAGNTLLNLINDVIDLSRLEAEQVAIVPVATDLAGLLTEIQTIFIHKAAARRLQFETVCPPELPLLYLDSLRLRQILLNLTGNALKFTRAGSVRIVADFQPTAPDGGTLRIQVIDTGIGIPPEAQQQIFEPFTQQNAVRGSRPFEGSGLGLTICRHLLAAMKGELTLESEVDRGSVFTVTLPHVVCAAPPMVTKVAPPAEPAAPAATGSTPQLDGKVLLVDDVPLNLQVLSAMLRKLGIRAVSARSGLEALQRCRDNAVPFQIVLTDLWMPEMDGEELARLIREMPGGQAVRIYAITADTEAANNFDLKLFDGVLHKPVVLQKLKPLLAGGDIPPEQSRCDA